MRILLLNLYYPPDTSATSRMAQIVAQTLASEHEVTVLCGRPSYDPAERRPWRLWQTECCGQVRVIRVGSTDYPRFAMRRRVLNYLSYVALSALCALGVRCDVVLAMTDPPFEGIAGAFVALLKGKPFLYNIRDLYPDMAVAGAVVRPGLLTHVWDVLHRWALRHAARVVVLGDDMRARIISKGVSPDRVAVIRDGAEIAPAGTPQPPLDEDVVRAIRGDSRFVLLHAGNLGFYGAWDTLIAAAKELAAESVALVFVGDGAQRAPLQARAAGLANVRFLPFFSPHKIPSVLAAADVHVVTIKRGLEGIVVPSKMYGILGAGRPLLVVAPQQTDAARLCAQIGCGLCCDPASPGALLATIRELAADPARLQAMGEAAKSAAPNYDRAVETRKFLQIAKEAASA